MELITIYLEEGTLGSLDVFNVTDDGLTILEPNGNRTPITDLLTESNDEKTGRISVGDLRR